MVGIRVSGANKTTTHKGQVVISKWKKFLCVHLLKKPPTIISFMELLHKFKLV